jgi:hypothetical protein
VAEDRTFLLFSNGQIRGKGATCLEAPIGGAIRSASCQRLETARPGDVPLPLRKPVPAQDFTLLFDTPNLVSTAFSSATEVDDSAIYYRTFALRKGHLCVRRIGGVDCADWSGGSVGPPIRYTIDYSDAQGWNNPPSGTTLMFSSLTDETHDVCGRGYWGIICARGAGSSFGPTSWWTLDYSTDQGWAFSSTYYGTLRLADIDGDRIAEVCGRGAAGIYCSTGTGASFLPAVLRISEFSDALGWAVPSYAESIQFGDVNGDGRDDVCGRGEDGVTCATSSSGAGDDVFFEMPHVWTFDSDPRTDVTIPEFGDLDVSPTDWKALPSYYRSLRLVDINRDGYADLCGRSANGVVCSLSTATAFEERRLVLPEDFTDFLGWDLDSSGSTLSFGVLDDDERIEVCGRGFFGIVCGAGP